MMKDRHLTLNEDNNERITQDAPKLRLVTDNGNTFGENWLKNLVDGTVFVARPTNSKDYVLGNYMLARRSSTGDSTNLHMITPDRRDLDLWVSTLDFSRQNKLHEVLQVLVVTHQEKEETEEVQDGDSIGTI